MIIWHRNPKPKPNHLPFPPFFLQGLWLLVCGSVNGGKRVEPKSYQKFSNWLLSLEPGQISKICKCFLFFAMVHHPPALTSHYVYCLLYSNPLLSLKTLVLATLIGLGRFHRTPRKLTILPVFFAKKHGDTFGFQPTVTPLGIGDTGTAFLASSLEHLGDLCQDVLQSSDFIISSPMVTYWLNGSWCSWISDMSGFTWPWSCPFCILRGETSNTFF